MRSIPVEHTFEAAIEKPSIAVISGPSGVGKGTVVSATMEMLAITDPSTQLSVSWTTRSQRDGESDGSYIFVSGEEFEIALSAGGFLEWTEYNGNYYGTPNIEAGQKVLLEIEVNGAKQVQETARKLGMLSSCQFIYILSRNPVELITQLFSRKDKMDRTQKVKRFATFVHEELAIARHLGAHVVVNDDPEQAASNIISAMNGEFYCDPRLGEVIASYDRYNSELLAVMSELYPDK